MVIRPLAGFSAFAKFVSCRQTRITYLCGRQTSVKPIAGRTVYLIKAPVLAMVAWCLVTPLSAQGTIPLSELVAAQDAGEEEAFAALLDTADPLTRDLEAFTFPMRVARLDDLSPEEVIDLLLPEEKT